MMAFENVKSQKVFQSTRLFAHETKAREREKTRRIDVGTVLAQNVSEKNNVEV